MKVEIMKVELIDKIDYIWSGNITKEDISAVSDYIRKMKKKKVAKKENKILKK